MKNPSPLVVWQLLFVVIAVATTVMLFTDPMKQVIRQSDGVLARTLSRVHFKQDELGILFFGNSLLNQALPVHKKVLHQRITEEFKKAGYQGKPIVPVKITTGGVNAFRLQALSDKLIATNPSIIVIQSEMFVGRHRETRVKGKIANQIGTWSGVVNLKLFGKAEPRQQKRKKKNRNLTGIENAKEPRLGRHQNPETLAVAKVLWANQVASADQPEFIASRNFVRRVSSLGIRVVVVELPVSETAARFATDQYFRTRSKVIQQLSDSGVVHMIYPRILPDQCFRDYSHLNGKGRDEFVSWFFPALAQALVKNEIVQ